jgi:hypothetical protein
MGNDTHRRLNLTKAVQNFGKYCWVEATMLIPGQLKPCMP